MDLFKEFKIARANAQNLSCRLKVGELASLTTSEFLSGTKCGHPGNFPINVVSKSFLWVVKVVQKLENTEPNNVWSGPMHLKAHEHGDSDPWSEL